MGQTKREFTDVQIMNDEFNRMHKELCDAHHASRCVDILAEACETAMERLTALKAIAQGLDDQDLKYISDAITKCYDALTKYRLKNGFNPND